MDLLSDSEEWKKSVEKWFEGVSPKNMKRMKWGAVVGLLLIANPVYNVNPGHRALIFDRRSGLEDKVHRLIQYLWNNFGHGWFLSKIIIENTDIYDFVYTFHYLVFIICIGALYLYIYTLIMLENFMLLKWDGFIWFN